MNAIIEWISSIGDLISALLNFIIDEIASLVNIISHLPEYISYISSAINILPTFLTAFAGVFVGCMILIAIPRWLHG